MNRKKPRFYAWVITADPSFTGFPNDRGANLSTPALATKMNDSLFYSLKSFVPREVCRGEFSVEVGCYPR